MKTLDQLRAEIEAAILADTLTNALQREFRIAHAEAERAATRESGLCCPVCGAECARFLPIAQDSELRVCGNQHRWARVNGRLVPESVNADAAALGPYRTPAPEPEPTLPDNWDGLDAEQREAFRAGRCTWKYSTGPGHPWRMCALPYDHERNGGPPCEFPGTERDRPHPVGPTRPQYDVTVSGVEEVAEACRRVAAETDARFEASVQNALHDDSEPGRGGE